MMVGRKSIRTVPTKREGDKIVRQLNIEGKKKQGRPTYYLGRRQTIQRKGKKTSFYTIFRDAYKI